jgi:hypothetical protein
MRLLSAGTGRRLRGPRGGAPDPPCGQGPPLSLAPAPSPAAVPPPELSSTHPGHHRLWRTGRRPWAFPDDPGRRRPQPRRAVLGGAVLGGAA